MSFLYESEYETKHKVGGDTHLCTLEEQCKQTDPKVVIKTLPPVDIYLLQVTEQHVFLLSYSTIREGSLWKAEGYSQVLLFLGLNSSSCQITFQLCFRHIFWGAILTTTIKCYFPKAPSRSRKCNQVGKPMLVLDGFCFFVNAL